MNPHPIQFTHNPNVTTVNIFPSLLHFSVSPLSLFEDTWSLTAKYFR